MKYRAYSSNNINTIPQFGRMTPDQRLAIRAVSRVLPFRINNYVLDELIDWDDIPNDPMFQLGFPQQEMLSDRDFGRIAGLIREGVEGAELEAAVQEIQLGLNPHPAGQIQHNVPVLDGERQVGMQHKYRETVLFFPKQGQTCHAYCTYCFRWAQFVGMDELKFANGEASSLVRYLQQHPEVTDVLFTGGDPMIMRSKLLRQYIEPLLGVETLHSIRIGSKSLAWWPYRYLTDADSDDVLGLFEEVVAAGKHLALMAHCSHPRELSTPTAERAVRQVIGTGATIRSQAPVVRHVNDSRAVWASNWQKQVDLGITPYYMFVERDTGPKDYFDVPLHRALDIFNGAFRRVSGLGRTVRGPSMSCTPGKLLVDGVTEIAGERVFALKFIQARDARWVNRLFFAKYDEQASWVDNLVPAFGEERFFFESEMPKRWRNVSVFPGPTKGRSTGTASQQDRMAS
jgi:L-lysine 2,3-aminomutase